MINPARLAAASAVLLLAACGGSTSGGGGGAPSPSSGFGLDQRVTVQGVTVPTDLSGGSSLGFTRAFPNLTFNRPVAIAAPPDGSNRLFVCEQGGQVHVFANQDNVASSTVFLDLSARVSSGTGEEGLLAIAFDPNYAQSGIFYVHYTAGGPRRNVIERYQVSSGDPNVADASSRQDMGLAVAQPFSNHNGGGIAFGPDGMLYVAIGDGGSADDPQNNGQTTTTLLGKILRLDVSGTPYAVPTDNPFVGQAGFAPEIYAYGLRNPWRISFDRQTGDLWTGDVGQGAREEVSIVPRGGNLGWRIYEGNQSFNNPQNLPASQFSAPVLDYGRSEGGSVIGGYVYRGPGIPSAQGNYFYGDYASGRVWSLAGVGGTPVQVGSITSLSSFGEDEAGELFACSLNGQLFRLVDQGGGGGGGTSMPTTLSGTGLFRDLANLVPQDGILEYAVNVPAWADGAVARRWVLLPGTSQITFSATGNWAFPVGTIAIQHLDLETSPGRTERIETRLLVHHTQGWRGYTYQWNSGQTDADLVPEAGRDLPLSLFTYRLPSRNQCLDCHSQASGVVLGLRTGQLNGDFAYALQTDNQLRAWDNINLFDRAPGTPSGLEAWVDAGDTSLGDEERVRSYLASNCAHCHQPGGPAPGSMDMRYTASRSALNLIDVAPTEGDLSLVDPRRVAPGDRVRSILYERAVRRDSVGMPRNSVRVDSEGTALLAQWIDGL